MTIIIIGKSFRNFIGFNKMIKKYEKKEKNTQKHIANIVNKRYYILLYEGGIIWIKDLRRSTVCLLQLQWSLELLLVREYF